MGVKDRYEKRQKEGKKSVYNGVKHRYLSSGAEDAASSITDRVNTWLKNHNSYISNYKYRYGERKDGYENDYVSDSGSYLDTVTKQKSAFDSEADSILSYMDQYKDYFNEDWMKSVRDTLTGAREQQKNVITGATKDNEWWSSFGSDELVKQFGSAEEAYKYHQRDDGYRKKYGSQKADDIIKALNELEDGEEKDWLTYYQYDMFKKDSTYSSKATSGWKSYEAQLIAEQEKEGNKKWYEYLADAFINAPADTSLPAAGIANAQAAYRNDDSYLHPNNNWSQDQKDHFGYLYAESTAAAHQYAKQINNQINAMKQYEQQQAVQKWAGKNFGTGVASTIGAIVTAPLGLADILDNLVEYSVRGEITQKGALTPFDFSQAATSGVANKLNEAGVLDEDIPIIGGKGWGDVYSLGVSAANSLVSAYTLGGTGTLVNFIGQGGAAGVDDALSRGATAEQALLYGTILGAAEGATEMISADNLLKVGSSSRLKNYLIKALNQGLGESVEEGASSIIGNIADAIIMQDKSNLNAAINEYMEDGLSKEEATKKAWLDMVEGVAFDALGGFVTGSTNAMVVGGGQTLVNNAKGNQKNIDALKKYGDKTDALIQEGLANDKKSDSYFLANKYQQQVQGKDGKQGKALTGAQIRNLLAANHEQVTAKDIKKIEETAVNRLVNMGQRGDLYKIAELATKYATGGELTRAERSFLANNKNGAQITSELLNSLQGVGTDSLLSKWENDMSEGWGDNYSTEWAEGIETKSVYNRSQMVRSFLNAMANLPVEDPATYKSLEDRVGTDAKTSVSKTGQATIRGTDTVIDLSKPEIVDFVRDKNGKVTDMVLNVDGKEVKASEIDFADEDQSYLFYAVQQIENITPEDAKVIVRDYDPASGLSVGEYLNGIDEGFTYGYYGYSAEDLKVGNFTTKLSDVQMTSAYELGKNAREADIKSKDIAFKKMRTEADAIAQKNAADGKEAPKAKNLTITYNKGNGEVVSFDEAFKDGELDEKRSGAVGIAKILHKLGLGTRVEFFSSYESDTLTVTNKKTGKVKKARVFINDAGVEQIAYSGVYRNSDGTIRVDLEAYNGKGLTLNALAHELTHFIQQWSSKKYKVLVDFLMQEYEKTDMTMHERVLAEQKRLEDIRGEKVSYNEAYDEVVANAMSKMFDDGNLVEKLTKLKAKDKNLVKKLWEGFKEIMSKFLGIYQKESALFRDAADLMAMKETFEQLQNMFAEALVEASENYQASLTVAESEAISSLGENANVETNDAGEMLVASSEDGNVLVYSEHTYDDGGREKLEIALRQNGHTDAEIQETLSFVDDALDYIKVLAAGYAKNMGYTALSNNLVAEVVTNVKTGKQVMSAIVNNGDYPVNIDLSLICKKRVAYMNLMSRLITDGVFDKVNYDGAAIAEVNEILRENGFETACLGCFVESRRLQFQTWAETIVSEWNSEVAKRNPNAEDFGFAKGKMEELTDTDIDALTKELEGVKKNDQGNVNLGQGNSVTRMGRLLDALPSLQKKLTVEDLLTPEGLTALRKHDGSLFSIVKSRYGAASPKIVQSFNPYASEIAMLTFAQVKGITNNAVKGAQAYITEVRNEYSKLTRTRGESKENFKKRKEAHEQKIQDEAMRRYLYDIGGARIQSFSDFMIENIFDYIQIFADLAAKRLPLHGYSKEIVCLRLFGMTGAKWNGSLIAHVERSMGKELAGLLPADTGDGILVKVDGKDYVIGFDDYARNAATNGKSFIQSIGMKDIIALQLDPRYSPYVGNITIGVSDAQILAMLDSPLFRMVIPYHASGMLPMFAKLVGVDMYNDYTDYQNTTVRQYYDVNGKAVSELKNSKGESVKADTSYAFNAEIQKTKDARAAANNYLKWCAQRHPVYDGSTLVGYATFNPKFSSSPFGTDFTRHENYYKLLEDFNTYDCVTGESSVQGSVTMNFPSEENRLTEQQMADYKNALRETGIFSEKDIEKYAKKADMTFKEIIAAEVGNRANYAKTQTPKWESTVKAVEAKLQKDHAREQYSSHETDIDTETDSAYDSAKKETEQEDKTNVRREEVSHRVDAEGTGRVGKEDSGREGSKRERCERRIKEILREKIFGTNKARTSGRGRVETKETRADFESRVRNNGLMYVEIGGNAFAFNVATKQNENASIAASKLMKFGFDVVVYDGNLQHNGKGVTETSNAATTVRSAGKLTIFISSELDIDGMETAYHEAFHAARYGMFAKYHEKIADIVASNIDVESESFDKFVSVIADLYAYTAINISSSKFAAEVIEELYAWYVGKTYATESGEMKGYMAQFSDVETIKKQIAGVYAQMEANTDKALPGLLESDTTGDRYSSHETDIDTSGMDENAKEVIHNLKIRAMSSRYRKGVYASYSADRIVRELERSSATKMDYAKSYIAWVNPIDFLYATTISQDNRAQIEKEAGELDLERLRKQTQPIHLTVDFESGKIVGHEGRHRMIALHKAGVEKVAVIFDAWNDDRYNTKPVDMMRIGGQDFDKYHGGIDFYAHDMLPLSKRYADAAKKLFSEVDGSVRYSEHDTDYSNRSLLANAFEGITKSSAEYKLIQDYKGHIRLLNEYEEKLSKINSQIREIRFTEGKYDAKKLKELEAEAKNTVKEINRHDQKLLWLEASEPLRKLIERERKKEAQKTKAHVKEIQQNKKVRAEQAEYRHKIRKAIRDLDKLLNRGNKKTNVKEDMKGFASKALELADYLFTDHISNDELIRKGITVRMTSREEALVRETEDILSKLYDNADSLTDEEFTRLDAKRKANEDKLRDLLKAQRNERLSTPVYKLFNDIVTEYAKLKNSNQDAIKAAYNPEIERFLRSYIGEEDGQTDTDRKTLLENMRVADMTTDELWKLHNAYKMILHSIRTANELFVKGKLESIEKTVEKITVDFSKRKAPEGTVATVARNLANKMGWDYEKLHYALDRIGSEAFTELVMNIANSENIVMQDVMEAALFRDQMVEKYGYNNWDVNKKIDREFLDNTGKKFNLTLGELMALYAYSRREGALTNLEYGGFVFGKAALTNPKPADSYKLNKEQCEAITSLLTTEQKGYAEDMQKYLSEVMGEKGNEVSMLMYGIKMFTEKNYFPVHIAGQFKAQANESQAKAAAGFSSMSNAGFTHAKNPNAKAPIVLEGFNEVWADHVNEMSRYHGTVPALEDMRRVMNRSSYSDANAESMAIKQLMENSYGKEAVEYFNNLYREANSGAIRDKLEQKSQKLLSMFRKNSVAYKLSVLVQQPASLVRAYALIDKKYFGFHGFGTITSGVAKAVSSKWNSAYSDAYNEMLKYAPGVTMAKEIGGFDTATGGSIRSYLLDTKKGFFKTMKTGTHIEKAKAHLDKVDDNAIANLPNVADKIAWIEIWNACKRETVAKHKDLTPGSDEFMQAVGDRFTEVIRATQVYDSIFAKSPMLKSKHLSVQYLVSFMSEPNTIANMAESAVRDVIRGDLLKGLKKAHVLIHGVVFTSVMKSIIYAMHDDDEEETYIEKYIEALTGSLMSDFNPLSYIPIARDVLSAAQGYDIERPDMAIVVDAISAVNAVIKNNSKDTEDMTEEQLVEFEKKVTEAKWNLVESLSTFFGIPVKNIRKDVNGVLDHAKIASANAGKTTAQSVWDKIYASVIDSIPFMQNKNTKTDKLYEAIVAGDDAYLSRLKSTYKTDDAYTNAVRKALRENDSRIHDAAQARYDGNVAEYKRIFNEIKKEGIFSFDDIMSAINSEENAIKNKVEPDKVTSDYTASGFVEAIIVGDAKNAQAMRDDIISTKVANGKTQEDAESEFASAVSTGIKNAYSAGLLDEAGAKNMLIEYAGKDEEEADSKVALWVFCEENPKYDYFNESNVQDWHEFAEPADISLEVFAQFVNGTKGLETKYDKWGDVEVSKRDQVLDFIDSLPLTWQQKDALYLAAGYAESKIWDVPW